MSDGRLRWQCRRGMRELDELLDRYLRTRYERAPRPEKAAFHQLLALSDPELIGYLFGHQKHHDPDVASAIDRIRCPPTT